MSRTAARETAIRLIYQWQLGGDAGMEAINETIETDRLDGEDFRYISGVLEGVTTHTADLDQRIASLKGNWKIERIAKVDLAILRLAIYEMHYRDDVPTGVAINEAVELAKRYGGEKSSSFVNGILGGVARNESLPTREAEQAAHGDDEPVEAE